MMPTLSPSLLHWLPGRRVARHTVARRSVIRWHVLLLPLCFIPFVSYWIIGPGYLGSVRTFASATALNYGMAISCVLVLDRLTRRVVRRYPNLRQTSARVWRLLLVFGLVTPAFLLAGMGIYHSFHLFGYHPDAGVMGHVLLYNLGANVLSVGIDETVYSLTKWRENALEREELKKANLQSQYESLKNQVNPHFLFNSLNSLSSLIADEPKQAEQFVDEMAKVYRYLLQTNARRSGRATTPESDVGEGELTTLADELQFIDSYYHLLKTRYQAGIALQTNVAAEYLPYLLPPLTLQMLVENAVKHNVIAATKPLLLEITTGRQPDGGVQLRVRNNLQRKTTRSVASNQVGLTNIAAKYRLLARASPIVTDTDGYFTVILPLIAPVKA